MIMDSMSDLFSELQWRGLVYDSTQGATELLAREKVTAYAGFDPTASSLHVGHLMQIMALARAPALRATRRSRWSAAAPA